MPYSFDFGFLVGSLGSIGRGAALTVGLSGVVTVLGTFFSVLGAAARRSAFSYLRRTVGAYVELIRNTPFLVQLYFIFFGLPSLGMRLDAVNASILALTVNFAAYGTEIVGAGLDAVPVGQTEAGRALGLKYRAIFIKVVLPQAVRMIYPALVSQIILTMLDTAAVSQIAVPELTYQADLIESRTFRAFEIYFVVTLIYLALSLAFRRILNSAGRRVLVRVS